MMLEPAIRFIKFRILHVNDSPHAIALGIALGLMVAYLPPVGFHIILLIPLTVILRANKFVAFTAVWISNPLTFVAIYYPGYLIGRAVTVCFQPQQPLDPHQISAMFAKSLSFDYIIANLFTSRFWTQLGSLLTQIGLELTIGGIILGAAIAAMAYFTTYHLIIYYRKNHPHIQINNQYLS